MLAAAHALSLDTINTGFRTEEDTASAIEPLNGRAEALYVCNDPLVNAKVARINAAALAARLPVMHVWRVDTEAGGLVSYGPGLDVWGRSAEIVNKILRGTKPADIPIEQPNAHLRPDSS